MRTPRKHDRNIELPIDTAAEAAARLDRKVRRLNKDLTSVRETSRLFTRPLDLPQVLEMVVKTVAQAIGADAAGLRLLDEEAGQLNLEATYGLSQAYINKGPVTSSESTLNMRSLRGEPIVVEDMQSDSHFKKYNQDIVREGLVSNLTIGLTYKDQGIGTLRLYSKKRRRFSADDISVAQTVAAQSAVAIVNARLYAEALEADRLNHQLKLAGDVQRHLIPQKAPEILGLDISGLYVPCHEVGGDFYDYITLSDERILLVIGDVMGKGVAASLTMASLRSALRAYAEQFEELGELVGRVNRLFCHDNEAGEFATLFCAVVDQRASTITYCNCGHDPPALLRAEEVQDLTEGGTIVGLDAGTRFETRKKSLSTGDMLIMYTDGLTDAMNFERVSFGRERIIEAARQSAQMSAERAAQNILWLMRKFTGLTPRFDDTALVVMKKV